jgi:FAD/FMN-containing dehydrogenase
LPDERCLGERRDRPAAFLPRPNRAGCAGPAHDPLSAGFSPTRTRWLNTVTLSSGLVQVLDELADLQPVVDVEEMDRLSKDFAWFSPILAPQLRDKRGEAAFSPASVEEIRRIVAACVRHRVPLSVRGGGTGNYGQLTPLHGGVIISLLRFNKVNWIRPGAARAQAGIRLGTLNREALATGWELRMLPSTYKIASLGGFYSGGTGGIGSINYGVFAARGNVLGAAIMTLEEEPRIVELRGDRVGLLQHCWGTAGIVLELEIGLAPAQPWDDAIAVFADLDRALGCASELAHSNGIARRLVSFHVDPVPQYLTPLLPFLPRDRHAILANIAGYSMEPFRTLVTRWGGDVSYHRPAAELARSPQTLIEYTWNHTTLNALKVDPTLTFTQLRFTAGRHLEQIRALYGALHPELMLHLEFIRDPEGLTTCSALPLIRFKSEARIHEIHDLARALGIGVANPHTNSVGLGNKKALTPEFLAARREFDPFGLMNPGKLAAVNEHPIIS